LIIVYSLSAAKEISGFQIETEKTQYTFCSMYVSPRIIIPIFPYFAAGEKTAVGSTTSHLQNLKRTKSSNSRNGQILALEKVNQLEETLSLFRKEVEVKLKIMQQILTNRTGMLVILIDDAKAQADWTFFAKRLAVAVKRFLKFFQIEERLFSLSTR